MRYFLSPAAHVRTTQCLLEQVLPIIVMDSNDPQSKNPLVERFLTLLKRNLLKEGMDLPLIPGELVNFN